MLLTNWPHTIIVHVAEQVTDDYGNVVYQVLTDELTVPCRLSPMSTTNDAASSRVEQQFKCTAAFDAPLKDRSRAVVDGQNYTISNVLRRDDSPSTRHTTAILRREQ